MAPVRYRSIGEIKETLQNAKAANRKCTLLIGAGCSLTAGIPTAAGFVDIIKRERQLAYQRASEKTYAKCMAELLLSERRDLIARYVDKAQINWAHLCIGLLMQAGFVDRVLTTNFDLLAVKACAVLGVFPAIYDFATSQLLERADIPDQSVFYLHGQRTGFVLMNTDEDMERHAKLLGPVFDYAGSGQVWIVVGYSGENDPVFNHLATVPRFNNGLFWIGYQDREPAPHVREHLVGADKDAFFTKGFDADSFFVSLARELELFPPDLVARPFTYLERALTRITPFVDPSQHAGAIGDDVLRTPRSWIQNAIAQFETPAWEIITQGGTLAPHLEQRPALHAAAARYLIMAGRYEQVLSLRQEYDASPSPEFGNVLSMAYVMKGNVLLDRGKAAKPPESSRLFTDARAMYEAALAIRPDRQEALHNYANLLLDQAKASYGDEARHLFEAAETRYCEALAVDPRRQDVLVNFGNLLLERAKREVDTASAARYFEAAKDKYKAALEIKSDTPAILVNRGNLLVDMAKREAGSGAKALLVEAETQYKAAVAARPDMHDAFSQWGNVLLDLAKASTGVEAEEYFQAAEAKYRSALEIKPDMQDALNNWGNLMLDRAKAQTGATAERYFSLAHEKYRAALDIHPGDGAVIQNMGNLFLDWGNATLSDASRELRAKAMEAYEIERSSADLPGRN
ncbi:MAG: hypothetical protein ABI895_33015 [Deltaproteobacteria bacterium]